MAVMIKIEDTTIFADFNHSVTIILYMYCFMAKPYTVAQIDGFTIITYASNFELSSFK